jgi:Telomeric repeat-binding factor 2.
MKKIISVLLVFIIAFSFVGCTKPPVEVQEESVQEAVIQYGRLGDTLEVNGLKITFLDSWEYQNDYYNAPGHVFITLEFEIVNNNNTDVNISAQYHFAAYVDNFTITSNSTAIEFASLNGLDVLEGTVASGRGIRGTIIYEIPEDWDVFEVEFTPYVDGDTVIFISYYSSYSPV